MFPPTGVNGLFDHLLPQGQVHQELQHDPSIQNTKELLTEKNHYLNIFLLVFQLYRCIL